MTERPRAPFEGGSSWHELRDGGYLHYKILGEGDLLVITGGAHSSLEALRPLAAELSSYFQVLLWDRRNTGLSDICFDAPTEEALWSADLIELLDALDLGPAHMLTGPMTWITLRIAVRRPDLVRSLTMWNVMGGWYASSILAGTLYVPYIMAAWANGMRGVAAVPDMAARIAANPRNFELLMEWEPVPFIDRLRQWTKHYVPDGTAIILGDFEPDALRQLDVPTLIFAGGDDVHPPAASKLMHELITGSRLIGPPRWDSHDYWSLRERGDHFSVWRELAPEIVKFLQMQETLS